MRRWADSDEVPDLVIVNADDWGTSPRVTDSILACFETHSISSTSAMVWMDDSERAAALGRDLGLAAGLHLNLTARFADPNVPRFVCDAQERVLPWFTSSLHHIISYNTSRDFQLSLDTCVEAQIEEFRAKYGRYPTHIDGHNHVQLAWNVLTSRAIPDGTAVRSTRYPDRRPVPIRVLRWGRERWLRHRFRTTNFFYDLRHIHPDLGGIEPSTLGVPSGRTVEVMAHPGIADEFDVLQSESWHRFLNGLPLGSFDDLR